MKMGKVIGTVVSTVKLESMEGVKFLLLQPLNEVLEESGEPLVAADTLSAGEGDIVYYDGSREAGQVLTNWFTPIDAAVMGIVDSVDRGAGA